MPTLSWLAAPDGAAVYLGQRWLEFTGLSADEASGGGWTVAVHQDDIDRLTDDWHTARVSRAACEIEVRLRRFDGHYRPFLFCAAPLDKTSDGPAGWCVTNVDIDRLLRSSGR